MGWCGITVFSLFDMGASVGDKITSAATYAASGGAIAFGLTANEIAALVGAGIAVITFFVNLWFKTQHLKLAKARLDALDDDHG